MKKKIVEVDEDVLKEIIVGDIPVFGKDSLAPKEKPVEHQEAKSPASTVPADTPAEKPSVEKPKRKKDESCGYRERFLVNIPASNLPMCISTVKWPSASNGYCLSSLRR